MEAGLLLTADQIRRIASGEKLAAGVVEKDYALTWLLRGIYLENSRLRDILVLKGGTAIRKVYFPETWRFSEDLDFTLVGTESVEKIGESIREIIRMLLVESGINYSLESFHATEAVVIANFQFLGPLNFPNRIRQDITLRERMVLESQWKTVATTFPDLLGFSVLVYPLMEILVEKIRSIMQRGYSRDYYDVWRLLKEEEFMDSEVKGLLVRKCELNGIEYTPDLLFDEHRLNEAGSFWVKGLGHLTRELPTFETVISELRDRLDFLQE